jgi:CTP synthase (UTP-ammonia lyase)
MLEEHDNRTMRLGAYTAMLLSNTRVSEIYGFASTISERHRHRYEVNITYKERLTNCEEPAMSSLPISGFRVFFMPLLPCCAESI